MSAYIVEDETINKVLAFLRNEGARNGSELLYGSAGRALAEVGCDIENGNALDRLGQDMFDLNVYAVEERYGKGEAKEFRPLDFKPRGLMPPTLMQALKALQCWLYQCSESDADARPLYRAMHKLETTIARAIIANLPEYHRAEWG